MPNPDLNALADRAEGAGVDEQFDLVLLAWDTLNSMPNTTDEEAFGEWRYARRGFVGMLTLGAYESAALMLVPEGWTTDRYHQGPSGQAHWWRLVSIGPEDQQYSAAEAKARTAALALVAACLRAHAAKGEG